MDKSQKTVLDSNKFSPDSLAIPFLILAVIILFLPTMLKWWGIFHDDQAMWDFPLHYNFAKYLQEGIMPLWNPQLWCGANIHHYALCICGNTNYYLPVWPFYFLANLNNLDQSYWMITILPLLFHYILAATGMFVLLKRIIKCNYFASFIGAFAYIYSPIAMYSHAALEVLIVLAWLPWLMYVYIKAVEEWRLWKLSLGGLIFAFIWLGTRPLNMPFVMIIWGGFVFLLMFLGSSVREKKVFIRPVIIALIMFVLGMSLSAIKLYPIFEGFQDTLLHVKLEFDAVMRQEWGMLSFFYLVTLFVPNIFGSISGINYVCFKPFLFWEANMSGGMATTLAVISGALLPIIVFSRNLRGNRQRWYAILGVFLYIFSLLCALGKNTPFYRLAIGWIPIVGGLPIPARYRMIQCFAVSLLIAIGINCLISFGLSIPKKRLIKLVRFYILFSFFVVGIVLFLPQNKNFLWLGNPGHEIGGKAWLEKSSLEINNFSFFKKGPVGVYTPRAARVKKIRVMFNGESEGEIRYSDSHTLLPGGGTKARSYYVPKKGWFEFDVDIPPNKFLWIYPKSVDSGIGHWEGNHQSFNHSGKSWVINIGLNPVGLYLDYGNKKSSLFFSLKNGYIVPAPVIASLLYWLLVSVVIITGLYFLSAKKFGYFLGVIVLIEFFTFGMMAFYGGLFHDSIARTFLPMTVRAVRPSDSPMIHRMVEQVPTMISDQTLRIATDHPPQDSCVLLSNQFALMGYGVYPMEKRFKRAIEKAYGHPMNYGLNDVICRPRNTAFLNNFSVGYFLSSNLYKVFSKEEYKQLRDDSNFFLHINHEVLPRVYTLDKVIPSSEEKQLKELVAGDLREAVYVNSEKGSKFKKVKAIENHISHFKRLQRENIIQRMDFSNPNQIDVDINVKIPAMLVLTEVWYPGWEASIDGKQAEILRVNYCQRGIWLEKGFHRVRLEFRPSSWRIGAGISLVTIGLMAGLLILPVIRRKGAHKVNHENFRKS